jgi:hypothetical protein
MEDVSNPRYAPSHPLPNSAYVPGKNPHPEKVWKEKFSLNLLAPEDSLSLRFALDLHNHGFYWETHEVLEALWNEQGRQGEVADFLKALIHVTAAGLKVRMGRIETARHHLLRAQALLVQILITKNNLLGFDVKKLVQAIEKSLNSKTPDVFEWRPEWKI